MRRLRERERNARERLAILMNPATDPTPDPPRVDQDATPDPGGALPRSNRGKRLAALTAAVLVPLCALLAWQAVGYRQVRADLDAAATAFESAREARAREVAPESWQKAAEAMDQAMAELHRQEDRLVPFRSYPRVHELLTSAIGAAADARASAEAAVERAGNKSHPKQGTTTEPAAVPAGPADAMDRAREAVDAVKATLERANAGLARVGNCPRAMHEIGIRRYVQRTGGTLEAMAAQVRDIDARFEKGDHFGATVAAESLKVKIDPIIKDLDGMATKVRCKKTQ
jgi:hypothetical protein